MANIRNGQTQIHIILTWIVRAINKVIKKAIECLGLFSVLAYCGVDKIRSDPGFVDAGRTVFIELYYSWPFHEH